MGDCPPPLVAGSLRRIPYHRLVVVAEGALQRRLAALPTTPRVLIVRGHARWFRVHQRHLRRACLHRGRRASNLVWRPWHPWNNTVALSGRSQMSGGEYPRRSQSATDSRRTGQSRRKPLSGTRSTSTACLSRRGSRVPRRVRRGWSAREMPESADHPGPGSVGVVGSVELRLHSGGRSTRRSNASESWAGSAL
jgi:hypothetical protein